MRKLFNLGKRILESNIKRLDFPYKLNFIATYKCNSKCKTCEIWKRKAENELTLDEIKAFFKNSNRFSWVDISGGEIFLRRDIADIMKAIISNCKSLYLLHFPTNGLLPNIIEEGVERIMALNPNRLIITVSLDGPPEIHNKIRGINGWDKAIETYKRLREINRVEVYFGYTLSHYNLGNFMDAYKSVKQEIRDVSYADFHINIAHSSEYYNIRLPELPTEETIREIKKIMELKGHSYNPLLFLEEKYLKSISKFLRDKRIPFPCKALTSSCFIDAHGDVYPCSSYNIKLGNIRNFDYNLERIWNLPVTKELRKKILKGECSHCWTPCEAYQTILGNLK